MPELREKALVLTSIGAYQSLIRVIARRHSRRGDQEALQPLPRSFLLLTRV